MFSRNTVTLSPALHTRAAAAAKKAGYSSLEEFVAHAVEKELVTIESAEAAEEVTRQLRGLGYIE